MLKYSMAKKSYTYLSTNHISTLPMFDITSISKKIFRNTQAPLLQASANMFRNYQALLFQASANRCSATIRLCCYKHQQTYIPQQSGSIVTTSANRYFATIRLYYYKHQQTDIPQQPGSVVTLFHVEMETALRSAGSELELATETLTYNNMYNIGYAELQRHLRRYRFFCCKEICT
ncbi:hypothetical protein PoB_006556500 [Plakobranchus ocellatus]|uniref:Uncharacterized protein n=1 Tax=Plakobranchus ocellatus TaxID=259542 RepID=A0AAV4D4X2_9GAST|nr:hypothetical protein PoB_006556500 [Plakobranchus ocellatus]